MPIRPPLLSAKGISALKPGQERADGALPGLRVRRSATHLHWTLFIVDPLGRRRRFPIGDGLSLTEAREKATDLRRRVREGHDPHAEKHAARERTRAARDGVGTLRALVASYYATGPGAGLRSRREQQRQILYTFAKLADRPAAELRRIDVQLVADAHPSATSAGAAVGALRPILRWASKRSLVSGDNWRDLEPPARAPGRERDASSPRQAPGRHLSHAEIATLVPALRADRTGYGTAALFALLTAARRGEVAGATWQEFDLEHGLWAVSGARRKTTKPKAGQAALDHVIPLSTQARRIVRDLHDRQAQAGGVVAPQARVFTGAKGGVLDTWGRWLRAVAETTDLRDERRWSMHALRRTCATLAGHCGTDPHVISAILGHRVGNALQARYQRGRYLKEHAESLQRLADLIDAIVSGTETVVPLRRMPEAGA